MTVLPECTTVRQIRLRAKAKPTHPIFKPWQTARIAILIRDEDGHRAILRAEAEVARRHWEVLERHAPVNVTEECLLGLGDEVWSTYERAVRSELVVLEFPEQVDLTSPSGRMFAPPVLTESERARVVGGYERRV